MSERIGEDKLASRICQLACCVFARLVFTDICLDHRLIFAEAHFLNGFFKSVDEVKVISGVLIMEANQADLEFTGIAAFAGSAATTARTGIITITRQVSKAINFFFIIIFLPVKYTVAC